jgi:hypothetical protein
MDNSESDGASLKTITGQYVYVGNPCTTTPCLPGMAFAVTTVNACYYLTIKGHWFSKNRVWGRYTPEPGDLVTVVGYVQEKQDVFGKPFQTIEAVSLKETK